MTDKKSNLNREFCRAHDNTPKQPKHQAKVPDMIRREKPVRMPRPPSWGHQVNAELFNQRWAREVEAAALPNQFNNQRREKMLDNAQVIKNSGLKLSDKFERIEQRAKDRKLDRGRER